MRIDGAGAVVTGGASGLGEACVRALVTRGATVTILDVDEQAGRSLADELGTAVAFAKCNVTADHEVGAAVAAASGRAPLRIAINCAGVSAGIRTVDKTGKPHSRNVWQRVVGVNLTGTFHVMTAAAAAIQRVPRDDRTATSGVIINTASIAAFEGQLGQIAYAASKGGVVAMTLPAARDLAPLGIRVCAIAPGTMDTPMLARLDERGRQSLADAVLHPSRMGRCDEFAELAVHIVENDYLNAATIRLDGGLRMSVR
jgi:NAD(P)-dependent dehydrogenase (short-subunit alcohol dehydrogenase family)